MGSPDGYQLRPPTPDDLDAVADVVVADELDGTGQVVLGADFVRAEWSQVDELAADRGAYRVPRTPAMIAMCL